MTTVELQPITPVTGRPLYELVRDCVHAEIDAGRLNPGDRLPSTKVLSSQLQVSLVTVHRALQELVASGVLRRGQGRGTFVHEAYASPSHRASVMRCGLVFHAESSLADSYHGTILEGIRSRGHELGIDLVLLRYGEDWRNECQGYIYISPFVDQLEKSPRFGAADSKPAARSSVTVGARWDSTGMGSVDTDNIELACAAIAHLAELGHKRVAYVGGGSDLSNNSDRLEGYRRAVAAHGLDADPELVLVHPDWQLDEVSLGRLALRLSGDARPTAVFAAGYYFALNCYTVASRVGLSIPGDLSVVGVDDPPSAIHLSPALTTMRQPLVEVGRRAIEELHRSVTSPSAEPAHVTLDAELIVRGSATALAPTAAATRTVLASRSAS